MTVNINFQLLNTSVFDNYIVFKNKTPRTIYVRLVNITICFKTCIYQYFWRKMFQRFVVNDELPLKLSVVHKLKNRNILVLTDAKSGNDF